MKASTAVNKNKTNTRVTDQSAKLASIEDGTECNEKRVLSESALIEDAVVIVGKPARVVGARFRGRQRANPPEAVVDDHVRWNTGIDEPLNNLSDGAIGDVSNDQVHARLAAVPMDGHAGSDQSPNHLVRIRQGDSNDHARVKSNNNVVLSG
jgi:hypothetical protein